MIKKLIHLRIFLAVGVFFNLNVQAQEQIESFDVTVNIQENSSMLLVSNLNSFAVSANTNLTSMPAPASSGGSGFSGGGFGGGVGSW